MSKCSICALPRDRRVRVEVDLNPAGSPSGLHAPSIRSVANNHGISHHALGRHLRNNHVMRGAAVALTRPDDAVLNLSSILDRLVEASESARRARVSAEADGRRPEVLKAVSVETQVLGTLLLKLGVTDTTAVETLVEARKLAGAVGDAARESPVIREAIAEALERRGAEDTAADLRAAAGAS